MVPDIYKYPKVLISVVLEEEYEDHTDAFSNWLCKIPGRIESVRIEGVFNHGSTLLLVSMPVAVWDLLPDHQAYSFVSFIRSENLLFPPISDKEPLAAHASNTPQVLPLHGQSEKPSGSTEDPLNDRALQESNTNKDNLKADFFDAGDGLSSGHHDVLKPWLSGLASLAKHTGTPVTTQPLSPPTTITGGAS
jgi:hypothetical protein